MYPVLAFSLFLFTFSLSQLCFHFLSELGWTDGLYFSISFLSFQPGYFMHNCQNAPLNALEHSHKSPHRLDWLIEFPSQLFLLLSALSPDTSIRVTCFPLNSPWPPLYHRIVTRSTPGLHRIPFHLSVPKSRALFWLLQLLSWESWELGHTLILVQKIYIWAWMFFKYGLI